MDRAGRGRGAPIAVAGLAVLTVLAGVAAVGPLSAPTVGLEDGSAVDGNQGTGGGADEPVVRFRNVTREKGLRYVSDTPSTMILNGGIYALDYDDDGWPDLLTTGGPGPALFENAGGQFERTGALPAVNATVEAAHVFDFDNDGTEDVLLLAQDRAPLLLENRDGRFVRRPGAFETHMTYPAGATSADYDGDGCLDVFVFQYADWADRRPAGTRDPVVTAGEDNGNPNALFAGDCRGSFERTNADVVRGSHWTLAASFYDFTGDGRPDVHVANDFAADVAYVNRGDGTFQRTTLGNETNRNAMSSEVFDADGDGRFDVFVTNIALPELVQQYAGEMAVRGGGNNLLLDREGAAFEDAAGRYGVRDGGWGWAAVAADFDGDGDQDLFHTTKKVGLSADLQAQILQREGSIHEYTEDHPSLVFPRLYERSGERFLRLRAEAAGFEETSGTGVARLDFDRDGDPDLAVAQVSGRFLLYENAVENPGNWVRVAVEGSDDMPATGARVAVTVDGTTQRRLVNSRADLLSQDSRVAQFGVGGAERVDRVRVVWPDGTTVTLANVSAGQRIVVGPDGRRDGDGDGDG
jgi:hypothetical protein